MAAGFFQEPGGKVMSKRRIVVTGIGAITPLGLSARETWKNALEGKPGVGTITNFDTTDCPVTIAAEVRGFDVTRPVGPFFPQATAASQGDPLTIAANSKDARRVGRFVHFALSAG